jgi:hypothetical protein
MTKSRGIGRGGRRSNQTGRPPKAKPPPAPCPPSFDVRKTLEEIAANPDASATARVAACRALLLAGNSGAPAPETDPITLAALKLLNARKR